MPWLRRGWLLAIACMLVIGGAGALLMRLDLATPEPTVGGRLFTRALDLHGAAALGGLFAALVAIPTLVVTPGRGAALLGWLALALWAVAVARLMAYELLEAPGWPRAAPPNPRPLFGASLALGAAQLAVSLPANTDRASRPQLAAAAGGLAALAIVALRLVAGELPTASSWLLAITVVACGLVPDALARGARAFVLLAIAPCLALAWLALALVREVPPGDLLYDTPAVLAPLPLAGGALLGTLLLVATRARAPRRRLAHAAAILITAGTAITSIGFLLLGSRGMPRRLFGYPPEYLGPQLVAGAGAVLAVLGAVAAVAAFRRGAHEVPPRAPLTSPGPAGHARDT